jgi:hypothetical protein
MTSGDLQAISPSGQVRTLVSAAGAYGGQIVAAAWASVPSTVRYRPAQPVTGMFAGGPVQKLAADGDRLVYAACGRLTAWTPTSGASVQIETGTEWCSSPDSRDHHVGTLAMAGDRVLWWWTDHLGLGFFWSMYEAAIGAAPIELAKGYGNLGATPDPGIGTAAGSGSLLVMSAWTRRADPQAGRPVVAQQTVERVEPGGCPCTMISSSPGPYTPLDVDEGRIVVSGDNETRILSADGTILLSLPVPTQAAQLSGSQLVLATGSQLRVYDAHTGALAASWPLPADAVGHDCDSYADPSCVYAPGWIDGHAPLLLQDVAHGLAAYVYAGQVHLLRLSDGSDKVVGDGTLARFMNPGLAYADGARIRLVSYDHLPLQ